MAAVAVDPIRLVLLQMLHLRAMAQRLPLDEAARRHLGGGHGSEAPASHLRVVVGPSAPA